MIYFGKGNYWDQPAVIRVNTVNCVGVMGKGIAREFKERFPEMFQTYAMMCKLGHLRPGKIYPFHTHGLLILNVTTKQDWRQPSCYEWVEAILRDLRTLLATLSYTSVTIPALGCGNGGLDWNRVLPTIGQHLQGLQHQIYLFHPKGHNLQGTSP